jgi:predicted HicB family RNase H-like nuclease
MMRGPERDVPSLSGARMNVALPTALYLAITEAAASKFLSVNGYVRQALAERLAKENEVQRRA